MILIHKLKNWLMYPAAHAYIAWQSNVNKLKGLGKKDQIRFTTPYAGQKIMLMALYEQGRIREDVLVALHAAKALGIYIIGINSLKLTRPDDYLNYMDCYIERYNFGRDFGSYKSGFGYIYANGLAEKCPRLLMINDSVFFSRKHISKFLQDMFAEDFEVLGATENFEIEYHLGSFCIAMNGSVLNKHNLKKYWKTYKCSDVRPTVIKTGEMKLSRVLKGAVSSLESFRSLYDTAHVAKVLQLNTDLLDELAELTRNSTLVDWPRFSYSEISKSITERYLHTSATISGISVSAEVRDLSVINIQYANSATAFLDFMRNSISNIDGQDECLSETIKSEVISHFIDCFSRGSQIHQNNAFLHKIGLPIIKLDGLYRGMFVSQDVENIAKDLEMDQQEQFRRNMYSRPFGGAVLFGWKRAAFYRGLI
jgi:hypothetical protein